MSPSLPTARPLWVWSLPAFAIILSLLWFRKKRGSLKTDSGGAGETQDDPTSVEARSDEEAPASDISEFDRALRGGEVNPTNGQVRETKEVVEVIDEVKLNHLVESDRSKVDESKGDLIEDLFGKEEDSGKQEKEEGVEDKEIKAIEESIILSQAEEEKTAIKESANDYKVKGKSGAKTKCNKKKKMKDVTKKLSDPNAELRQSKDENTACILEKKLAKLELGNQCNSNRTNGKQTNEDVAERDSANNSPSEVMLASPSVSGYSDTHSEGSSDSGKGCSEMLTPSRTPASGNSVSGDLPVTSIYEFVIPQQWVGRLIGRHGSYVNEIKETTHASIYIKRHPDTPKLKICAVEGTQLDIENALDMIRRKFPKKRYPSVTLEQVVIAPEPQMIPIISESMQLYLIEGINNDVLLSSLVSAGHFFLQQPTHPTYLSLSRLNSCMTYCYSEPDQPTIPEGVGAGILCAAPVHNGWYRAQITEMDAENKICNVKFVDYGGYMTMPVSLLRQIRFDFVNLPFQAAECYLAGVKPANEENIWCEKSKELVEKLTFGKVLQAQVYGYAEDGVPLIYLYTVVSDEVILINQELVSRGFAEWVYTDDEVEEELVGSEPQETAPMPVAV